MLEPADYRLIQHDPALPGLALLLDPQALVTELATILPEFRTATARIGYLRYKPGQSCLAGYRFLLNGVEHNVHAKAYRPEARDKIDKYRCYTAKHDPAAPGYIFLDELGVLIARFPCDRRLPTLQRLGDAHQRHLLLRASLPEAPEIWSGKLRVLRYKPERRYVACLQGNDGRQALIKVCTPSDYAQTLRGNKAFVSRGPLKIAGLLGHRTYHQLLCIHWLEGQPLDVLLRNSGSCPSLENVGAALVELHAQEPPRLAHQSRASEIATVNQVVADLGVVYPELRSRLDALAARLTCRLGALKEMKRPLHGDLHSEQVLLMGKDIALLDFDQAVRGDPVADIGSFLAQLECQVLNGKLDAAWYDRLRDSLLEGYRQAGGQLAPDRLALYTACGLLARLPEPFRQRWKQWPEQTEALLERAETMSRDTGRVSVYPIVTADNMPASDCDMGFLSRALEPSFMASRLRPLLTEHYGAEVALNTIRLRRQKPGRRCLIEYTLEATQQAETATRSWLGKIRNKGLDRKSYTLQHALRKHGFDESSPDAIGVPKTIGVVEELNMWLQEKVPGEVVTKQWDGDAGITLAERVAAAVCKLHQAPLLTQHRHTLDDELTILRRRLHAVVKEYPLWRQRIEQMLRGCERLAMTLVSSPLCGIHRDFYPDQVLLDGVRLYLLDLDLYCCGDPALDIGNFVAHMMEYGLRSRGDIEIFTPQQQALKQYYLRLNADVSPATIQGYITLSLARHIAISTEIPERRGCTGALLEHCEQRLELFYEFSKV